MNDTTTKRGVPRKINGKWYDPKDLKVLGVVYWLRYAAINDTRQRITRRITTKALLNKQNETGLTLVEPRFLS